MRGRMVGAWPALWRTPLLAAGFEPAGDARLYCRDGIVFGLQGGWGYLRAEWRAAREAPLRSTLGRPGLWKTIHDRTCGQQQPVLELPPAVLAAADPRSCGEEGLQIFAEVLAWGLGTAPAATDSLDIAALPGTPAVLDTGWEAPAQHLVEPSLPAAGMTIQVGHLLRQIVLIHGSGRLALQCPILDRVPADLTPGRSLWLPELLLAAHNRWKLVRIGLTAEDAVRAEVDLTGVPAPVLQPLLRLGQEALRYAVQALLPAADFLAEADEPCQVLEVHSPRAWPASHGGTT